jgi:hypothetical protein
VTFATWVAAASGVEVGSGVDVFVGKGVKVGSEVFVGGKGVEVAAWLKPEKLPHAITMIDTSTRKYSKRFMKISSCFYVLHPQTAAQKYIPFIVQLFKSKYNLQIVIHFYGDL